jgi:ABC-type Zn uptake system ZnuABC Zn-binding protein ZnuA
MSKVSLLFTLVLGVTLLGACSDRPRAPSQPTNLNVLATESFLGDIAQNIAGNRIKVDTLLPVSVDPHEYALLPQDFIRLEQSQVLIVNGLGYETWMQKALDGIGGQRLVIITTNGLTPNPDPSGEHSEGDPHMWMDPLKVINYVDQIRDGLSQADPAGKTIYARNATSYISKLHVLDEWIRNQVSQLPAEKRLLVTNHDALGYFAQAYHFKVIGAVIPTVTTDASPSAQQLAELIDTIKKSAAPAIFLDVGENRHLAEQIASETGIKVITDLYVESISGPNGPASTYIDMIKYDVTTIIAALK